ncbi:MAG: glycosyl transferase family 28 [Bacteroidetes bacterium]|nr:glycosyl transferase family 28 [Bacteroidota bacterium]
MNLGKINKKKPEKRILIAPLDWGLGHATRCIPLIKLLIQLGAKLFIAADGDIAQLLQKEFPGIAILRLKGYQVQYSKNRNSFFRKMLSQAPSIIRSIRKENKWLQKTIIQHEIDAVISDNRFGLHSTNIPSVFITHQLHIQTGNPLLNKLAQQINYRFIHKFSECWVPDSAGNINLAGTLSHPDQLPSIPVKYIGVLSRFHLSATTQNIDMLVLISGPEPQRSLFENILLEQLISREEKIVVVRGLPGATTLPPVQKKNITFYNHCSANELNQLILQSKSIIARCGYSTIMDLVSLQRGAVLVPTPGQTEQEWLGNYLADKKIFITAAQEKFNLQQELEKLDTLPGNPILFTTLYEEVVTEWYHQL